MSDYTVGHMNAATSVRGRVLVVTALPDPHSLLSAVIQEMKAGFADHGHTDVVIHDLVASGFDPVFGPADLTAYRAASRGETAPIPADVQAEQELLLTADVVVVAFPLYWWSLPAVLKGWIDRVMTRGWAYETAGRGESAIKALHFVGLSAFTQEPFERHGYAQAMTTQLEHGIASYMNVGSSGFHMLFESESDDPSRHANTLSEARNIGATIADHTATASSGRQSSLTN